MSTLLDGCDYLYLEDLQDLIGNDMLVRFFVDDGSGDLASPSDGWSRMGRVGKRAEADAAARLLRGWTSDQIVLLMQNDDALRTHVAWMALHYGSERKEAFQQDDGSGAYPSQYKRAIERLKLLSEARQQSPGEAVAGLNDHIGAGAVQPTVQSGGSRFAFAPTRDNPKRGGMF